MPALSGLERKPNGVKAQPAAVRKFNAPKAADATPAPLAPDLPSFARAALNAGTLGETVAPPVVRSDPAAAAFLDAHCAIAATVDRDTVFVLPRYAGSGSVLAHEYAHVAQLRSGAHAPRDAAESAAERASAGATREVGGAASPPLFQVASPKQVIGTSAPGTLKDDERNPLAVGAGGRRYLTAQPAGWTKSAPGYKPQLLPPNPVATFNALMHQVEAIHAEQRATAERLKTAKDMKYWFARVYEYVTENEIAAICATPPTYMYPHMKMQEVIGFHATYRANLDAWERGAHEQVESNWSAAFAAAESSKLSGTVWGWDIKNALLPSMQAHIRFDLPRAIASAYFTNYSGIPKTTIDDFHVDFAAMGPVFDAAQAEIEPELISWHERNAWFLGRLGNWRFIPGGGSGKRFWGSIFDQIFDVAKERDETWAKATMIAAMEGLPKISQPHAQQVVEAGQQSSAFKIGGVASSDAWSSTTVVDYDWLHQPSATGFTSPPQTADEKASQIEKIINQWFVSDGDVAEIVHILSTVRTQADMNTIRRRVEPDLHWHLTSPAQFARVSNALNRGI